MIEASFEIGYDEKQAFAKGIVEKYENNVWCKYLIKELIIWVEVDWAILWKTPLKKSQFNEKVPWKSRK